MIAERHQNVHVAGVGGYPIRTKAGELSISVSELTLLAPCLRQIPSTGFENSQKRFRRRYLDFIINKESKTVILTRSKIIKYFRNFFESRDFLEVETPILSSAAGGAIARPFTCHHKDLDIDLFLRVAPELYLKQLVIGGFDRVFEIGKQFRNEGVDWNHNPEFTSCEFYEAWADYTDLMETTEELLSGLVLQLGLQPHHQGVRLDFTSKPLARLEFLPSLESALGCHLAPPSQLGEEDSRKQLAELCVREGVEREGTVAKLLDRLSSKLVEPALIQPTLLLHQPLLMSPLAKSHRDQPGLAERFELFVAGQEVCNAYTELNDPEMQRSALAAQACTTDPEAMLPDELFCTALEYGLPPTAGWGCGLDRLTAILTGRSHIRDTFTFPLVSSRT